MNSKNTIKSGGLKFQKNNQVPGIRLPSFQRWENSLR